MGVSISICGVRDLDGQFAQMAKIKETCDLAGVIIPEAVYDYFKYPSESVEYNRRGMEEICLDGAIEQVPDECADVWEIDVSKLSPEVKKIRVRFG